MSAGTNNTNEASLAVTNKNQKYIGDGRREQLITRVLSEQNAYAAGFGVSHPGRILFSSRARLCKFEDTLQVK